MLTFTIISVIYALSVWFAYKQTQIYYKIELYKDPSGFDVFMVLAPVLNIMHGFVLISGMITTTSFRKFFRLDKEVSND